MSDLPLIGITMGDPAGVGPEIIVKALSGGTVYKSCRPLVIGDPEVLSSAVRETPENTSDKVSLNVIPSLEKAECRPGTIDLLAVSNLKKGSFHAGIPNLQGAEAMVDYILRAVEMARDGRIDAVVTGPISKEMMNRAGYEYEGHTQLISHLTGTSRYVMMLAGKSLRVSLVTIHCALKDVSSLLNEEKIYKVIKVTSEALHNDFGIQNPRLAVAGLNPHGGESGLFGKEEEEIIGPAVKKAEEEGLQVQGPFPADTLFYRAVSGRFEAVVAMYHDQGLIPLKLLHFSDAVNITLGLPIVRTSVDHGTAYEIAGRGQADDSSLKAAIMTAADIAENRKKRKGE